VARSLSNLATIAKLQGDNVPRAFPLRGVPLNFRDLGDRTGVAWSLNYQGECRA